MTRVIVSGKNKVKNTNNKKTVLKTKFPVFYREVSLDNNGMLVKFTTETTPDGPRVSDITFICPEDHPTGVTTAVVRSITARILGRVPLEDAISEINNFISSLPSCEWKKNARNSLSLEQYKILAAIYKESLRLGIPPTKTVNDWVGCSRPTASRLIKEAKDLGLLGPSPRRGYPYKSE